jgi:hypothetical protein
LFPAGIVFVAVTVVFIAVNISSSY